MVETIYPRTKDISVLSSRARAAVALTAAAALTLTACGSDEPSQAERTATGVVDQVEVTPGTDKDAPKITLEDKTVSVEKTEVKTVKEGKGAPVAEDDIVVLDIALFNGKDGSALEGTETYTQEPLAFDLGNAQMIPGLRNAILGQKVGSTATAIAPPAEMFGEAGNEQLGVSGTDSIVMVYDLKSTMLKEAKGKEAKPKKGVPVVQYATDKPATFTMPKGTAPKETEVETLVAGEGPEVKKGDTVYVTYTGALWKDGKVFDSSKQEGRRPFPVTLGGGQVIKGWDEGLVGTKVGDRVLITVPPKDGYGKAGSQDGSIKGDDTIVFVVDVLGAV